MNPAVVTTDPEFLLDLGRPISPISKHIIASVAVLQQPIQLLAVVYGRIGQQHNAGSARAWRPRSHGSCSRRSCGHPSGSSAHRGPLPHFGGLLLPPRWCVPAARRSGTTVPLRRHPHDTGVDDLPATRHVALGRKMLVGAVKQLLISPAVAASRGTAKASALGTILTAATYGATRWFLSSQARIRTSPVADVSRKRDCYHTHSSAPPLNACPK